MLSDYFKLAFNSLRRRQLRSWLTMIGIFIGIAAVVSLIGLGEGLRNAITGQFGFLGTDVLSVQASGLQFGPPGTGTPNPLSEDLADDIADIVGVKAAFNRYVDSGTLEFNDQQEIGVAVSVPNGENRKVLETILGLEAEEGRMLKDGDGRKVLLGSNFKEDDVFGKGIKAGDRVLLNGFQYEVVGILKKKGSFFLDNAVIVNEDVMLRELREDDGTADIIAIQVDNEEVIDRVQEDIEKFMRKERDVKKGEEDFSVQSPQAALETLDSTLFAVQLFVYIIASISLLVGGIGIMNTMYTAVVERTKEIGVMKSIGARNIDIFALFFVESGFLGAVGGLIGILIGVSLAYGLAFAGAAALGSDLIQAEISLFLIIGALLFSFVIGSIAGITPAISASRLRPVDALRYAK